MKEFQAWFAKSPIASALRTFLAIVLAAFLADGADVFAVDGSDLRTWVAMGVASCIPALIRYINPADTEFGNGASR